MELFKLFGTIAVNNQEANDNIDETTGKAEGFGSSLAKGIGTVAKWGSAVVGATALAVGGMVKFAESSASSLDNIDKMSQKIGISREAYQELDFICSQTGTSVDGLQMGMKTLTAQMDAVTEGNDSAIERFARLGVEVTNTDGTFRSQEDVLYDTLEALQNVEDQTEKSRLATELFGRSGTELMPLLNSEAGSLEDMKNQAHELGLVLDDELIDNGVQLTDVLDQTERAFSSIFVQLGGALMPIIVDVAGYIQTLLPTIQSLISGLEPVLTQIFESLLPPLMDLVQQLLPPLMDLIKQIVPPLTNIISSLLPIVVRVLQMILPVLIQLISAVLPVIVQLLDAFLPILEPLLNVLQPYLDILLALIVPLLQLATEILVPLIELVVKFYSEIAEHLTPVLQAIASFIQDNVSPIIVALSMAFSDAFETIRLTAYVVVNQLKSKFEEFKTKIQSLIDKFENFKTSVKNKIDTVKTNITNTVNTIKSTVSNVFTSIKNTATTVWNGVKDAITTPIETAKNTIQRIVNTIKGFFSGMTISFPHIKLPHFSIRPSGWKIEDLLEGSIPTLGISWYAKGGIMDGVTPFGLNGGQLMVGGEAGKEAIVPLENDTKGIELIASKLYENMPYSDTTVIQDKMNDILKKLDELSKMKMVTETGALVGQLAPQMDSALGNITEYKGRGLATRW